MYCGYIVKMNFTLWNWYLLFLHTCKSQLIFDLFAPWYLNYEIKCCKCCSNLSNWHILHLTMIILCSWLSSCSLFPSGCGLQAQEHSALARELLPFCSSSRDEKLEVLICLLSIHLTQGGASLQTAKYPYCDMFDINVWHWKHIKPLMKLTMSLTLFRLTLEDAESSFLNAENIVEELHQRGGISQEEKTKTEQEISTGLSRCSS